MRKCLCTEGGMTEDGGMSDSVIDILYNAIEFDLVYYVASQVGFDLIYSSQTGFDFM